jgi:cysteine desulfurase
MSQIYFDNAATTAIDGEVKEAMIQAMDVFGNPSSVHALGRKTKALIEGERRKIAELFHCFPKEIIFTSGGTEADNLAILGIVGTGNIKTIISSKIEHPAVIESIHRAEKLYDITVKWVGLLENGEIDLVDLEKLLNDSESTLVSLMHVNNELGNVLDIERVGELCEEYNALFHTDTVQSVGHLDLDLSHLKVDLMTCSGHKIHGPKGAGFLFLRSGTSMVSLFNGGKQEREIRCGTENFIGIMGLGKALEMTFNDFESRNKYVLDLKQYFKTELLEKISGIKFNGFSGDLERSVNSVLNVNFPNQESNSMLLFQLDLKGIMVSGGSACGSGSVGGSPVLNEIGVSGASARFSFSKHNTKEEIDIAIQTILNNQ